MSTMASISTKREFDLVMVGATSFVGRLVIEYLLKNYGSPSSNFRWAICARNQNKVENVKRDLEKVVAGAKDLPTIIGDSTDSSFLHNLAKRTSVVLTTVGPYAKFGEPLVDACATHGTKYCDLTGELPWVSDMITKHEAQAKASGAYILHCCGFDSEPSDLGTHFMYSELKKRNLKPTEIKMIVGDGKGGVSGGTVHSLAGVVASGRFRAMANPYLLVPGGQHRGNTVIDQKSVQWDGDLHKWTLPFVMAGINTRVVARSSALLAREPFTYKEAMSVPGNTLGFLQASFMTFALGFGLLLMAIPPTRWAILQLLPPGSGPSEEQRRSGYMYIDLVGKGTDSGGKQHVLKGSIHIPGDPGYQETAKMIAETGVGLAKDKLQTGPGFLTPASALGENLIKRLNNKQLKFSIKD